MDWVSLVARRTRLGDSFLRRRVTLFALSCLAASLPLASLAENRPDWVAELRERSALDQEVVEAVRENRLFILELCDVSSVCRDYGDILRSAIGDAIDVKNLSQLADTALVEIQEESARGYLLWLGTPLGKKIAKLEAHMRQAERRRQMLAYKEEIQSLFETHPQRMWDLDALDEVRDGSAVRRRLNRIGVQVVEHILGRAAQADPANRETPEDLEFRRQKAESAVRAEMRSVLAMEYAYLTDDEFKIFLQFVETSPAREFNSARIDAYTSAVVHSARGIIELLDERLPAGPE